MSVTARIAILVVVSQACGLACAGLDLDSLITNAVKQVKQVVKQPDRAPVDGECHALCETMYTTQCLRHNCKADPAKVRPGIQHPTPLYTHPISIVRTSTT